MYDWQMNKVNMQNFSDGQTVKLNENWSGFAFLKREFGHLFPRRVASVSKDVVRLHVGQAEIEFASQCLSAL